MKDVFIEKEIIRAVQGLLIEQVNTILLESQLPVPVIGYSNHGGFYSTFPAVTLNACESTEKERIIRIDAYNVTVSFTLSEMPEGETYSFPQVSE
jgi:hypothetical protein